MQRVVVEDWFAEIEYDGFGSCAICVVMAVVVDEGIDVFGVVGAIGGRAHVGESSGKRGGCGEEKKVNKKPPCQMFI